MLIFPRYLRGTFGTPYIYTLSNANADIVTFKHNSKYLMKNNFIIAFRKAFEVNYNNV